jgi:hypothetical protein
MTIQIVPLPDEFLTWAEDHLQAHLELKLSPAGLVLLVRVMATFQRRSKYNKVEWNKSWLHDLRDTANRIVHIAIYAVTRWPLTLVVDLSALHEDMQACLGAELQHNLQHGTSWHNGEWSLQCTNSEPDNLVRILLGG